MSTDSIANEVINNVREKKEFSLLALIRNEYFLYAVSSVAFVLIWHWAAAAHILGKSLATPLRGD